MPPNIGDLLESSFAQLLRIAADTASEALNYWPHQWRKSRRNLKISVSLMRRIACGPRRRLMSVPFALTEEAFAEVRRAVGPDRLAVLVIDAIRSAARACRALPTGERIHVSDPTEDELRNRAAVHAHDALRLLEEIVAFCPDGPPCDEHSQDDSQPMLGFSARWGDGEDEAWPIDFLDWVEHEDEDEESGPFGFR
jgi:hypothetical protein